MTAALQIDAVHKRYGDLHALKGVSFAIQPGEFFGLLGPNGAGKSTTIGIICSLVKNTSGDVHVFGKSIADEPADHQRVLHVLEVGLGELRVDLLDHRREAVGAGEGLVGVGVVAHRRTAAVGPGTAGTCWFPRRYRASRRSPGA